MADFGLGCANLGNLKITIFLEQWGGGGGGGDYVCKLPELFGIYHGFKRKSG